MSAGLLWLTDRPADSYLITWERRRNISTTSQNVGTVGPKHKWLYIHGGVRPKLGMAHVWAIVGRNNKLKYCFFPSTYLHRSKIYSRDVRVPDISGISEFWKYAEIVVFGEGCPLQRPSPNPQLCPWPRSLAGIRYKFLVLKNVTLTSLLYAERSGPPFPYGLESMNWDIYFSNGVCV